MSVIIWRALAPNVSSVIIVGTSNPGRLMVVAVCAKFLGRRLSRRMLNSPFAPPIQIGVCEPQV
jgi:hypothetical protein